MRCLTLAKALTAQGWTCAFITEVESFEFVPALAGYQRLDPDDFYNNPVTCDLLVVDHYDCDITYESRFRPYAKKIMVIDDLANRQHDCDIILDQAYGRDISDYRASVPAHCHVLVGPKYALLRDEFIDAREQSLQRREGIKSINRIFINFGGNDQKNMILKTLEKLDQIGYRGSIDVVFGVMAEHRQVVEAYAASMENDIVFHTNPSMSSLLLQADLAVGAPAVSAWERFCMGVPTILIKTADNQSFTYDALKRDGLALGGDLDALAQKGLLLNFSQEFYRQCVRNAAMQTSGQGAYEIVQLMTERGDEF